ncbi:MAG TPA: ABC transporter permease [Desulfosporosinus sp.]|nr:ABC transporter permease [Desulfosporosinus sp.]
MFKQGHESTPDETKKSNLSLEHIEYLRRVRMEKIYIRVIQFLIVVFALGLWELCANAKIVDPFITSQPSRVFKTMLRLYEEGVLFHHIGVTCLEAIVAFVLGTLLGTMIAIILWWSEFLYKILEPYLVVLNSLPKIALGPVFIVWIGAGPSVIIVMTLAISLIVTTLEVLNGFLAIDEDKIKLVQTFGGTKLQVLTKVILPASAPTFINALKINVGLSWVGVIVGEFLVSKAGLGYLIVYGGQVFKLDLVMTSVIILGVAATVMYQGVVLLEKILLRNKV